MTELLTDPGHIRQDLQTIHTALVKKWDLPDALLTKLPMAMAKIAIQGKPKEQIAATKNLMLMKEYNDSYEQPKQIEHHHTHDIGPVTESNIEAQRAKRFADLAGSV